MKADALAERRIHVMQGEYCVSDDSDVILTTILGSCVAACMRDPEAQVGGMNHFLLPGVDDRSQSRSVESYGVHLMELLAKLFGGSATMQGLCDIGALNSQFAERFLRYEGIAYVGGSLGGDRGRRIQFWPTSGRARQAALRKNEAFIAPGVGVPLRAIGGEVELF